VAEPIVPGSTETASPRELGVAAQVCAPGPKTSITDVAGVRVAPYESMKGASAHGKSPRSSRTMGTRYSSRELPAAIMSANAFRQNTRRATQVPEKGDEEDDEEKCGLQDYGVEGNEGEEMNANG